MSVASLVQERHRKVHAFQATPWIITTYCCVYYEIGSQQVTREIREKGGIVRKTHYRGMCTQSYLEFGSHMRIVCAYLIKA